MKVGVLLGNKPSEEGGGYTFENELLQSLVQFESKSIHTFVVLSQAKNPSQDILDEHIQVISIHRSWIVRLVFKLYKTAINIFRKLHDPMKPFKVEHWSEPLILRSGVDVIWHLTPTWLTAEVPYITVVWELQHRLQPYFPEVSVQGIWDERDQSCGTILRRASVIIAGTEAGKVEIENFYQIPSERIKILPHPTPRYALQAPPGDGRYVFEKYNIPEGYVFYPAQFWAHKNHAALLLAIQWLRDQYSLVLSLALAGSDRGNQAYIRHMAADLNLASQVHFLDFVETEDLIALYRNAFCLSYITFCGPENLPPLEAFALGCPVVASDVAGAREQLGDAALLVDPKKPEEIAQALKSLWEDAALRQTMVERGLERASRFTGEDFVKGVFKILDEFETIRRCWSSKEPYRPINDRIKKD